MDVGSIRALIREIPDFPEPGVAFKDITPLLADAATLCAAVDLLAVPLLELSVDLVVGVEARGFVLAPLVAQRLGAGFVPVRKAGKLPSAVDRVSYELEYGTAVLEMHADAVRPGSRCVIVDDVVATGGTAEAAAMLLAAQGGDLVAFAFLIELCFLDGRARLARRAPVFSTVCYEA